MMPIGDDNSEIRITPFVNYILIALNILVFVALQQLGGNDKFTYAWATVPQEIVSGQDIVQPTRTVTDEMSGQQYRTPGLQPTPISVYLTLLSSMFMHGSIGHIGGNMLFLWIFGDNLENRLGHVRYALFYLLCGVLASLAHVFTQSFLARDMLTPSLGASGAISAVMGAYLLLFPRKQVLVIVLRFISQYVPAIVAVGMWIVLQIVQSLGLLGSNDGVAYAAHIGGFAAGLLLIKLFEIGAPQPA